MRPDEDYGPVWLRDRGYVEVEVESLLKFGDSLIRELDADYKPYVEKVFEDLKAPDFYSSPEFVELVDVLNTHQTVRMETTTRLASHGDGMLGLGTAAKEISSNYSEAEAFVQASVQDVEQAI